MALNIKSFKDFIESNKEDLSKEYRIYAIQHDYDLDGPKPFDAWVKIEYQHYVDQKRDDYMHDTNGGEIL